MAVGPAQVLGLGQTSRQVDGGLSLGGQLIDDRPSRIPQPQEAGDFVVGFAGGVVKRGAQFLHGFAHGLDLKQLGVTARDEQGHRVRQLLALQVGHRDVPAEVVDAVEGHAPRRSKGLGGRRPDEECAGEARPHGGGHRIWLLDARLLQRCLHHLRHGFEVGAGGNLRHHTAEACVLLHGGGDDVGADLHVSVLRQLDDAHAGFVAGGLDAED